VTAAIGGDNIGETVEGLQRFPINVRYPREMRDSVEKIRTLPLLTERGAQIRLGDVAEVKISEGPPMLKSENARLSGWVYVDIRGRDLSSAVRDMQRAVAEKVQLPAGTSISWSGQFEFLERATARLKIVVPATLAIIFVLLYFAFRRVTEAVLIMATLPFALVGGFWLMYVLGYHMSIASAVGFIALAGVAAEIGVVMLVYVNQAVAARPRRSASRAAGGDDSRRHHRGAAPHHVRLRYRFGSDATHRRADGGRNDHSAPAFDVRCSRRVPVAAPGRLLSGRAAAGAI